MTLLKRNRRKCKLLIGILVLILFRIAVLKYFTQSSGRELDQKLEQKRDDHQTWLLKLCKDIPKDYPRVACMNYQGRLGNLLYMYAFHYVYSMQKEVSMVSTGQFDLDKVFVLEEGKFLDESQYNSSFCGCMNYTHDRFDCGYDDNITRISVGQSVSFLGFFQSWRYWIEHEHIIRKLFTFLPDVMQPAERQFLWILKYKGWNVEKDLFVGIHVRRGDYAEQYLKDFGQKTAPLSYIYNAIKLISKIYKSSRVRFIVFSDNIKWCKHYMRIKRKNIFFVDGNTAAVDMALMTLTNHSIITAGTFGWWAAFLTNGITIYYKDLFKRNTLYAEQFPNKEIRDFFPPLWIGLDK